MPDSPARAQMIEAASRLFAKEGYKATTMRGVVEEAGAPWGSVHHYWPGGKEQLGVAAIEFGDQRVRGLITSCLERTDTPGRAAARYLTVAARVLEDSDWQEGCPVTTVALEVASEATTVTEACRVAIDGWRALWAGAFVAAGATPERAGELATTVVAHVLGALVVSRLSRSAEPMRLTAEAVLVLLDGEPWC